jgi:small GTP-binding protein
MSKEYKILLSGSPKVGKTSYLDKLSYSSFSDKYIPTSQENIHEICLMEKNFDKIFYIHEMTENKIENFDAIIIMCSVDIENSFENLMTIINNQDKKPKIIIVVNKIDLNENLSENKILNSLKQNYPIFMISVKTSHNIFQPLLQISSV